MNSKTLLLLVLLSPIVLFTACKKTPQSHTDYIILGWGGGFTGLYTYYIVENGQLKKDTVHTHADAPKDVNGFQFDVLMPDSMYKRVADLKSHIPQEMLQSNNATFGKVTGSDGGAHVVRTMIGNIDYAWGFEMDQSQSSDSVLAFYKRLLAIPY